MAVQVLLIYHERMELRSIAPEFDFIIINDGSRDRTGEICDSLRCKVITMPINCGLTVGFQTAVRYAVDHGYDYMIQFDADGQHRPEYLASLVEKAESLLVPGFLLFAKINRCVC